jgi:cyclase
VSWIAYSHGGRKATEYDAIEWAKRGVDLGAGEVLLTAMDADGTKDGFDLDLTRTVVAAVAVPVIASGGAGKPEHFADVLTAGMADAALAASVFHYAEIPKKQGIEIRLV